MPKQTIFIGSPFPDDYKFFCEERERTGKKAKGLLHDMIESYKMMQKVKTKQSAEFQKKLEKKATA